MNTSTAESEVRALYHQLIEGWNTRNAAAMVAPIAEDGELIGFDGSQFKGQANIYDHVHQIFSQHQPPPFVSKVKAVRFLSPDVADLRAIVGMVPPGQTELSPALNAHQTLLAAKRDGKWQVMLFQNTPAQFHGRPELVEQFTEDLRQ